MSGKVPTGIDGSADDPAQPGMGVDESLPAKRDTEVELAGSDMPHRYVTGAESTLCRGKAALRGHGGKAGGIAAAQGITVGDRRRPPGQIERGGEHTDAVKPGGRIAPVQAKAATDQSFRCGRQLRAGHEEGEG